MIDLQVEALVARITLSRPEVRNALDSTAWRQLAAAIAAVGQSDARALVLASGVEGSFCAGSNLEEIAQLVGSEERRAPFRAMMRDALDPLARLPMPVVAVIDGDCFGAGVALALACDIRVAGLRARFCIPAARLGVSYPPEDIARLIDCIGQGQAGRMLYEGALLDPAEALRIGLVERLSEDAAAEAERIARRITDNAPASVAQLKRIVTRAESVDEGNAGFDRLMGSDALREGLRAFREKRAPRF